MKKFVSVLLILALLFLNVNDILAENKEIKIKIKENGMEKYMQLSEKDAKTLRDLLNKLATHVRNIEIRDKIIDKIARYGLNLKFLEDNNSFACFFIASGSGIIIFTPGVLLAYLAKNGVVFPFIVYILILYATHIIPFRLLLPASYVMIKNGSISCKGGKSWSIHTNDERIFTVLGFSGITISIPIEEGFVFMAGIAAYVEEGAIFMKN